MKDPSAPPPANPSRRAKRLLAGVAALLLLALAIFLHNHFAASEATEEVQADLEKALAEVDRAEPGGWREPDLQRHREAVPDAGNGAKVVLAVADLIPPEGEGGTVLSAGQDLPPPVRLTVQETAALRLELQALAPALGRARALASMRTGRYPPVPMDLLGPLPAHLGKVRRTATLLFADVVLRCEDRDLSGAWASALAGLHAGSSVGDEPGPIAQLMRMGAQSGAVGALERILGQGEIDEQALGDARQRLARESRPTLMRLCLQAERAGHHEFYTRLAKGEGRVPPEVRRGWTALSEAARAQMVKASHAYTLRTLTRALECVQKPEPERSVALREWEAAIQSDSERRQLPLLAGLLLPAVARVADAERQSDQRLECAVAALAAEQFRLRHRRWPRDVAELVAVGLLETEPADLYDGQPLRLRHAPDGLVVYSVGVRRLYRGTALDNVRTAGGRGPHRIEFRLWDPEHRRQPALPTTSTAPQMGLPLDVGPRGP